MAHDLKKARVARSRNPRRRRAVGAGAATLGAATVAAVPAVALVILAAGLIELACAAKARERIDLTGWWVASVAGVAGGHTQGRTIGQAEERVREALALFVPDSVAATAELKAKIGLPPLARRALLEATRKRAQADAVAKDSQRAARAAARALTKTGMSLRDVGWLLGVSRQRAHQLVSTTHAGPSAGGSRSAAHGRASYRPGRRSRPWARSQDS
ncbi:MAG TPA: hypothetical protein VJN18_25265 [Polyangiaceae bacterium]|nr:hypothetical protein [Polyangiaceae bacterium]